MLTIIVAPESLPAAAPTRSRIEQSIWEIEAQDTDDDSDDERPVKKRRVEPPAPAPVAFRLTKRELERAAAKAKALCNANVAATTRALGDTTPSSYFAKLTRRKRRLAFD
ncbi:hypothetical protein SDRG_16834 [Saprolegnia diclina VS20]|uniref:Uncharacterized protein n=1 Tax=Saprolegnia diclina (strain VS20) TaxID=1156394 RepID=T0PW64_SAPDV|nr:hypothetical protein SDRG_16834 [Saprolegnia diclina VS20]EQC25280.1 hypothetical protein SDRG_16834 [Saprolegnia diclina VS20]|eukprot:XP_008621278.1 hypothetical protein SDRG_16834 [Saprolegnia diclina VS20]